MAPARDNVDVITDAIERVDGGAIVPRGAAGERRHAVDRRITAIGYRHWRSLLVNRVCGDGGPTLGETLAGHVSEGDELSAGGGRTAGGCKAPSTDEQGRNDAIHPGFASGYGWRTRRRDPAPYMGEMAGRDAEAVAA